MKYSVKLMLWIHDTNIHKQNAIYLKITVDRKTSYMSTGEWVCHNQWDAKNQQVKNHNLEVDINARISNTRNSVSRKITDASLSGRTITSRELKASLMGRNLHDIFEFTDGFIKEVQHKRKPGTLDNYRKHILKLELFNGSRSLAFEDITPHYLSCYETSLRAEGLNNNYVHSLFKTLKVFFNAAIKKSIITNYPFHNYENPVYDAPQKDCLSINEIKLLEKFADETEDVFLRQTAVYFLLGISTGLRISDWYKFDIDKHISRGSVLLRATKNGEWVSMPTNRILESNIGRMRDLPLTIREPTINSNIKIIATKLEINKHITSHTARHSFACTVCGDRGLSLEVTAKLMGISVETCNTSYFKTSQFRVDKEVKKLWKGL